MRYGPKTPWRGHSSSAFVSFDKHPRSRLFIEQSTWRGWAIESSQNSQNRNWNGTGALIKWSKTKPNGCVWCFLLGVACGYKKDRIHSGLLVFAKSSMIFQNITLVQKWPLNSKKNVRNFASQMGWVMTMSVVDCRLQIPSVSPSINECSFQKEWGFKLLKQSQQISNCCEAIFETKDGEAHCELLLWISFSPICSFATDNQTTN